MSAALRRGFLLAGAGEFFADGGETQTALVQDFGGKTFFFAEQAEEQMLGADVLVREALGFFGGVGEHALAFVTERKIDRSGDLFADRGVAFDLFTDRLHRGMRAQKTIGQGFIFAQQSEQQVFGLNIRRAELAGFIPREKDYAPGFLCIAFKHKPIPPEFARKAEASAKPMTLLQLCIYIA